MKIYRIAPFATAALALAWLAAAQDLGLPVAVPAVDNRGAIGAAFIPELGGGPAGPLDLAPGDLPFDTVDPFQHMGLEAVDFSIGSSAGPDEATVQHGSTRRPSGPFVPPSEVEQGNGNLAADLIVSFVSNGKSSGDALEMQVRNPRGLRGRIRALDGVVLRPLNKAAAKAIAAAPGGVTTQRVAAYCLDFARLPPRPQTLYQIADRALQDKYKAARPLLKAARALADGGLLRPDSEPRSYVEFIKQWAVWTANERWDEQRFGREYVARTKKNIESLNRKWTREVEQTIVASIPGRWRDIAAVIEAAR